MKTTKGSLLVISVLILVVAGAFTAYGEKYVPEKAIGAGANWGNGKLYFFKGDKYVRYSARPDLEEDLMGYRADPGYPKPLDEANWPGMIWKDVDAVVNMGNGKVCFFKGGQFIRYDIGADRADPGYPQEINDKTWPGLPWTGGVDAAVDWGNGKIFFFKGGQYLRYDVENNRADTGYPRRIDSRNWPGMIWTSGIDDVVNWGNGKAYFFKDYEYIRYDIAADKADPGYPKPVNRQTWPGLINW
ncbi:MAG TPA: hemopexin repeat-containing protein [Syntrophales bacterium]|mgnify:FL=1|jgi:matrix metalloproteinase-14 (membrane-inserted)|nr:hemopexin repeat-containing protein [Syntrophales bacterium]HON22467.1 hemopexin repeat-containing protein [Syntrophales bacterium]HOU78278.1 hemopexin repeat-containing protein [Syntrophales bacterium]HPC33189.1 hemopexin repeat-containing protein [Syntrophales bacterium]HQG34557.1 hemopexin repeat-containing protein [Syntrophales bacterium]